MLYKHNIFLDLYMKSSIISSGGVYMNAILGSRIKELRESKKMTQEYMAEKLECTRQRYSRIEKGESDISYSLLCKISNLFGIDVNAITEVLEQKKSVVSLFRIGENETDEGIKSAMEIINTFFAHKKIYEGVRRVE